MRAREKVKRRKIFSLSKIGKTWRQKAYHSIPLSGLSAVSQTQLGTEQKNWWISEVAVRGRARDVLCMSQPSSAAYRLYIPARAKFISYIALMPNARRKYDQRIAFQVEVIEDGDGIKITRQKFISPSRFNRDPKWIKFRFHSSAWKRLIAVCLLSVLIRLAECRTLSRTMLAMLFRSKTPEEWRKKLLSCVLIRRN